ncbi:MAG TPA: hypothetical protein VM425_12150 [Myxococcota bacterium]|nr:hypothetical protein [Myxococcota bacterium]
MRSWGFPASRFHAWERGARKNGARRSVLDLVLAGDSDRSVALFCIRLEGVSPLPARNYAANVRLISKSFGLLSVDCRCGCSRVD